MTVGSSPHLRGEWAIDGSGVVGEADELARLQIHSLRGASMPDGKTLLLAGERQENIWYQRAASLGGVWSPAWPACPHRSRRTPPSTRRRSPRPSPSRVTRWRSAGPGTSPDGDTYTVCSAAATSLAERRGRRYVRGRGAAGILALAPGDGGGVFVAGYRRDPSMRSSAWLAPRRAELRDGLPDRVRSTRSRAPRPTSISVAPSWCATQCSRSCRRRAAGCSRPARSTRAVGCALRRRRRRAVGDGSRRLRPALRWLIAVNEDASCLTLVDSDEVRQSRRALSGSRGACRWRRSDRRGPPAIGVNGGTHPATGAREKIVEAVRQAAGRAGNSTAIRKSAMTRMRTNEDSRLAPYSPCSSPSAASRRAGRAG